MKLDIAFDFKNAINDVNLMINEAPKVVTKAMYDCVLDLSGRSALLAPVETGDLRGNCVGKVTTKVVYENEQATGGNASPTINCAGIVGYSLPYALRQHEEVGLNHQRTDGHPILEAVRYKTNNGNVAEYVGVGSINMRAGGVAKFLEKPFDDNERKYIARLEKVSEELYG